LHTWQRRIGSAFMPLELAGYHIGPGHGHVRALAGEQGETSAGIAEEGGAPLVPAGHDDLGERVEIDRLRTLVGIEHLLGDPARACELTSHASEPLLGRNARLRMATGICSRPARGTERIEHGDATGLFMDFERASDVEAVMVEIKSSD